MIVRYPIYRSLPRQLLTAITCVFLGTVLLGGLLFSVSLAAVYGEYGGHATLPADCAVVFGAAVRPVYDRQGNLVSANAGPGIDRRVRAATELYTRGMVKRIVVSGGTGLGMRQSEATVMRRLAIQQGVDPIDILEEGESRSTEENVEYSRALMHDCNGVVAVSDRYHLARIRLLAYLRGWDVGTVPAAPAADWRFEARSSLREAIIIGYLILEDLLT